MATCYIVVPIEQEVEGVPESGYDPFYFPAEGGTLVFRFTDASFTRVLSALRNGAMLTYKGEGEQVIWDFLVNVEYPVSVCDLVAECFASDATFRESVIASLMSDPAFVSSITGIVGQKTIPTSYPPGVPNPSSTTNLAGTSNPTCDPDILWAQCLALVVDTNSAITDVLEKTEVSTNVVELIDALSDFPIVGWAKDAVGGSITIGLIQYYQEAVAEGYAAQYTTTAGGVQDQLACAIFCACQEDCEITVERMFQVYKTRLEQYVTVPSLSTMVDLLEFAAGINQDSTMVVDMAFFVAWGGAALGSFLYGKMFSTSFNLMMDLAVNDASDDWILLCEDCATPPPPDPECVSVLFDKQGWDIFVDVGTWVSGQGFIAELTAPDTYQLYIRIPTYPTSFEIEKVIFHFTNPVTQINLARANSGGAVQYTGVAVSAMEFSAATIPGWTNFASLNGLRITSFANSLMTASTRITMICVYPV